ncbi:GNAT family N-acetyltransferase [Thermus antranikianii]|uniref:GNAT family N-acetyltransferase n=1 Tax=Thermus antranikianii TaxID=88190 RepID=A0ABY7RSR5_9DEIN|nr:GNAT family N-acetyltransferase [Thermus antranikianii]QWK22822.1 MAG: GNAT family N-acetyltransferase [Thermus antranikianii]WCM40558.1 GNAT family N-acetyltransferase [Thermus antranikianii]
MIRPLLPREWGTARALLQEANLPLEGLEAARLFLLEEEGHPLGLVGYEGYPPFALLRSLVVAKKFRGRGLGLRLLRFAINEVKSRGFKEAYALSQTISELLVREGFAEVPRQMAPPPLLASQEFQGACPASARLFRMVFEDKT